MGIKLFKPNKETHPEFNAVLKKAVDAGVEVLCIDCNVGENYLKCDEFVPVEI